MSILATLFLAGAVAVKYQKHIEECYAPCAIALSMLLYLPGLYVSFIPGLIVFYALSGCAIVYLGWNSIKRRKRVKESALTQGFFFLVVCIAFFALYGHGRGIDHSDDFYFWDLRIKNFLYYGKIRGVPNTDLGDHPPLISIWDYLAAKTWVRSASHGIFLWAQNVLLVSFLAPVLVYVKKKNSRLQSWLSVLMSAVILLLIPTVIRDAYHTLLNDLMLGAILFYCFNAFIQRIRCEDRFYTVSFIAGVIALTMTKRTGAVFAVIVLFTCVWMYTGDRKKTVGKIIFLAAACAAGFIWSWSGLSQPFYVLIGGTAATVASKAVFHLIENRFWTQKIGKVLLGAAVLCAMGGAGAFLLLRYADSSAYLGYTVQNLWDTERMNPSFMEMFLVSFVMIGIILAKSREKGRVIVKGLSAKRAGAAYLLCFIGYFFLIWYLMITQIGPANGGQSGLNIRYFIPLLVPLGGVVLISIYCGTSKSTLFSLFIMAVILRAYSSDQTIQNVLHKAPEIEFYEFSKNNITLTPEDHVYFVDENDEYPYEDRAFYNYIFPARSQFGNNNFLTNLAGAEMTQSAEEWESELEAGGYNYVYIQLITEESAERYQNLFESEEAIGNGRLYQVFNTDDGIELIWLQHK